MTSDFVRSDLTHLLFIDSDIEFEPDQVLHLLIANKDIACGAYPVKTVNYENISRHVSMNLEKISNTEFIKSSGVEYATHIKNPELVNGWFKTDYAATGFLLVKHKVFERILQKNHK